MSRRSIEIESFKHGNPIPAATRIGPYVTCSITPPFNAGTRDVPETLEEQIEIHRLAQAGQASNGESPHPRVCIRHRPTQELEIPLVGPLEDRVERSATGCRVGGTKRGPGHPCPDRGVERAF